MGSPSTYDPQLRKTEHGSKLYACWKKARQEMAVQEFENFFNFHTWAMQNGYTLGARLFRYDPDEPHSPDNSFWVSRNKQENAAQIAKEDYIDPRTRLWCEKWDDTVNRIRLHYGMEPIYSSEV